MGAGCCPSGGSGSAALRRPNMARSGTKTSKEEKKKEKETMAITKFLRFKVPHKKHKIQKEEMDCFNGKDALNTDGFRAWYGVLERGLVSWFYLRKKTGIKKSRFQT